MFKSNLFIKSMFILTIVMIGYDFGMSIFSIPKIEESIYLLEEKNAKTLMSKIVSISNNVHTDIEFFKRAALDLHKKNLKEINSIAYSVLEGSYARYISGELSEDEAKKSAYTKIANARYGENGYFFMFDDQYNVIIHADKKQLGVNLIQLKDKKGRYYIKEMIDTARSDKEDYVTYWWPKIAGDEPFEKLSYIKKFTPWNIYLGNGVYIDKIEKEVEKRKSVLLDYFQNMIANIKIGRTGYIYVFNSRGDVIHHPEKTIVGTNFKSRKNPSRDSFLFDDLIKASKSSKELNYKWNNPDDKENYTYEKVSWIEYVPELDWYIVSAVYVDELEESSNTLKKSLAFTGIVLLFLAIFIAALLFKRLEIQIDEQAREIEKLKDQMALALSGNRDAVWDCSIPGESSASYMSERWQEMLGFCAEELPFSSFSDWKTRVHPDDYENIMLDVKKHYEGKTEFYTNVHREKHKDGRWIWIIARGKAQFDEHGNPTRMNGTFTDITETKEIEEKLVDLVNHDQLTGLYNRRYFFSVVKNFISLAKRENTSLSLMMIDIDDFKEINDSYGHGNGDLVIKRLAVILLEHTRDSDIVARIGGEEFVVLLTNTSKDAAFKVADTIRRFTQNQAIKTDDNNTIRFTISIGVDSVNSKDKQDIEKALSRVDKALYKAKNSGKNKVC